MSKNKTFTPGLDENWLNLLDDRARADVLKAQISEHAQTMRGTDRSKCPHQA